LNGPKLLLIATYPHTLLQIIFRRNVTQKLALNKSFLYKFFGLNSGSCHIKHTVNIA